MQHTSTSSEVCALLDRVLQTSQSLKQAIERYVSPSIQPVQAEPVVLPPPKEVIAPVLTIRLSDLQREGELARQRRLQHQHQLRNRRPDPQPPRPQPKPRNRSRKMKRVYEVEVVYRKGLRMVS